MHFVGFLFVRWKTSTIFALTFNLKNIKMKNAKPYEIARFYWNDETLEHFNKMWSSSPHDAIKEIEYFVKMECDLEEGETIEELKNDLLIQSIKY